MVDAAELDDVVEVDDDAFDELDEEEDFSFMLQPVAAVNAAVIATPTPKIRTTPMICLRSMTAIFTALTRAGNTREARLRANCKSPLTTGSVVRQENSGSC